MKGQNYSKKREAIYEAILSTDTHPSADWVYEKLKPKYPDLSLGTVYRNVKLLEEKGRIVSVSNVNGKERYDARTEPHTHFVCLICGTIIDIDTKAEGLLSGKAMSNNLEDFGKENIHDIKYVSLIYYGTCARCGR